MCSSVKLCCTISKCTVQFIVNAGGYYFDEQFDVKPWSNEDESWHILLGAWGGGGRFTV